MKTRLRSIVLTGAGLTATTLVALAATVWACTAPIGSTWYADGSRSKSGSAGYSPFTDYSPNAGAEVSVWTSQATPGAQYDIRFRRKVEAALPPCGPDWLLIGPEEDDQITADAGGNITPVGGSIPDDTPPGPAAIALMNKATGVCLPPTGVNTQQKRTCVTDGGLYRDFDKRSAVEARAGCERHHMPSKASQDPPYSQRCSPTILMSRTDHAKTGNWGGYLNSKDFRGREKAAISRGTYEGYLEAFEMNVTDVKVNFPGKYDLAIEKARAKLEGTSGWDNWRACIQGVQPTENADELNGIERRTQIALFATGATQNLAYTLVLGDAGVDGHVAHACMRTLQILNSINRFANSSGSISTTVGYINYSTPGNYEVCFKDNSPNNSTATAGASFTVL